MLAISFFQTLIAQCDVTKQKGTHSTTYINRMEKVYLNVDLENGVNKYEVGIVLYKENDANIPDYYMIQCRYTNSRYYLTNEVVPRILSIIFPDYTSIPLNALTSEQEPSSRDGYLVRTYTYEVSKEVIAKLKTTGIKMIMFGDCRTKPCGEVDAYPYADLLKEQVQCLTALSLKN
jgi:hypothetical protein